MGHAKPTSGKRKLKRPKTVLRLMDLAHSKSAVLNSLGAVSSQESYGHAIDEFITWYCSEPWLAFSRTVVLRYRLHLEQRNLAPSTINVRLTAFAGPKILRCTLHRYEVIGPDLDTVNSTFTSRYCDSCKDKSPRPADWIYTHEWQDEANK